MIAEKGDPSAIAAVSARLGHANGEVREAAVKLLGKIAEKGDPSAIAAVSARLGHGDWRVRETAVEALGTFAEKGDDGAIAAVAARLEDANGEVREAAESHPLKGSMGCGCGKANVADPANGQPIKDKKLS